MRRPLLILSVMLLAGAAAFYGGQRLVGYWCAKHLARLTDDLDWLRLEFRLNEAGLARRAWQRKHRPAGADGLLDR